MRNLITVYSRKGIMDRGVEVFKNIKKLDIAGAVDLISGGKSSQGMKNVEESTHILICRYTENIEFGDYIICDEDTKTVYEVTYVDNPMARNRNLEIELKLLAEIEIEEGE